MTWLQGHPYLLLRRLSQVGILALFWLGAHQHLGWLTGNLSSSRVLRTIPLSDPFAVLQILATGRVLSATVLVGALLVLLFYLLVGGRSFCAWVCPLNMITDLAGWLRQRLEIRGQLRVAREARFWVMGMAIGLSALLGVAAFEWLSPIAMFHRELIFGVGFGLLSVVGIFLLDLFVLRHGWCGSLCPLGAFYSLLGRLSLLRIGFDSSSCDRCGDCLPICPEPQVIRFDEIGARGFIDDGQCLNCARCLEVCPRGAFSFISRFNARPVPNDGRGQGDGGPHGEEHEVRRLDPGASRAGLDGAVGRRGGDGGSRRRSGRLLPGRGPGCDELPGAGGVRRRGSG